MTTFIPFLIAAGVGIALGIILFILWKKVDKKIDDMQRAVNYLENAFAAWGSSWMSEFLANIVVGDEEAITRKIRDFFHADNKKAFFTDKIAFPIAKYVLREFNTLTPEQQKDLEQTLTASKLILQQQKEQATQ